MNSALSETQTKAHTARLGDGPSVTPKWVAAIIFFTTLALFWPATSLPFIKIDDMDYVVAHPLVSRGLSWMGLAYPFVGMHAVNWHPLTTISHMIDCQIFGVTPAGPHLVNIILHSLNAALLFGLLRRLTGLTWRSAVVAMLFSVHPLRVESVVWISERKDVLSAFFFLLTIWSYTYYVEASNQGRHYRWRYWATLFLFILAVLSKPMVVTLPFVLLLLDYWPLQRFFGTGEKGKSKLARLILEKVPFLFLSAVLSYITFRIQHAEGAMTSLAALPLSIRIPHVIVSYVVYLSKIFWPANLAMVYPYEPSLRWQLVAGSCALLVAVSYLSWRVRRVLPQVLIGWLWFLGTLVPVIGLVQVGEQANADRYTYLPSIGVLVALVWTVSFLWNQGLIARLWQKALIIGLTCIALLALGFATHTQIGYWRSDETLMRHSIEAAGPTELTCKTLGTVLVENNRLDEGVKELKRALAIDPNSYGASSTLAVAYAAQGKTEEAERIFRRLLATRPSPIGHFQLADFLQAQGRLDESRIHYLQGLSEMPYNARAHNNLGNNYATKHELEAARKEYERALIDDPRYVEAYNNLATLLMITGKEEDAISHWKEAIRLKPEWVEPLNNLAWVRATHPNPQLRNGSEAVELAKKAVQVTHAQDAQRLDTLAAAYAEAGKFDEAIRTARTALTTSSTTSTNAGLAMSIQDHLKLFEQHQPVRDTTAH